MNEPGPTRLVLLRFLERVQLRDLARTRQWIADEERRDAERRRGIEEKPTPPDWLLEQGLNRGSPPVYVHTGDCWNTGKRSAGIAQEQARQAIADGVKACPHCRPDSALGIFD
ncbi:DUF6233 domain-containing protein [Streptomyces sp. ME03-5684b]|uniref:DUF6233 domain-containing protein n=1 Tax=Streptomyces sp. ME03-5684b TaxID=3028681 RepID=UPI0029ACFF8F|nr:DUF6233 domain-containing protein [Streptomyces sp. ME03-5684b]MDX3322481.1 DUF6233 domain-containing protein [Streptomyces sp. ME03-5684b]